MPKQKPIRVLHVITRLIVGGAQENTMFTAALLDKDHYQVDVICGPQTGSEGSLIDEVRSRDISLIIMPELLRQISPWLDIRALWKLYRLIRHHKYAIVHTHSSKAGILGRIAARLAGTPIIIHTVHGWSFHDHMSRLVKTSYIWLERLCARFSDALIAVANRDIEKGLRNKIGIQKQYICIRSAIPLDEFTPARISKMEARKMLNIPIDAPVLGNVGRFSEQKNPLDWVRVAGIVSKENPECWFLLVGDGPLRLQVEAKLIEEGIAGRTVMTGLRRDIPYMMTAMDVFLLTSLWEGLPRVIPEAMHMGLPVVANGVDGSQEAIRHGETGFVAPPGNIDQLAQYCLLLLQNNRLRLKMGESAHMDASREFDVNQMVGKIEELYKKLLVEKTVL